MRSVVIHYGEVSLKGRNRPWFLHTLVRTIRQALAGLGVKEVRSLIGRIIVKLGPDADWVEVRNRLLRIPGISNFALATHVSLDLDAITAAVLTALDGHAPVISFRVISRRADKRFPFPSPAIERHIGAAVQQQTGWRVNLSDPAFIIRVETLTNDAFFFFDREPGTGGLPIGTGGRVMTLISGGIDSPVAAWRLMRRGCRSHFVHFHSYPLLSSTSQEKVRDLVRTLTGYQLRSRLFLVPFAPIQQQVVISVPPHLRVVTYRRLMMRIAERLAIESRAHALVTGDAVGQVASQTIENLAAVGAVATLPVLRPLIGMDKEEITRDAQRLGTYQTSIIPDDDCCTLFTPRYPSTGASLVEAAEAERQIDVDGLVEQAATGAVIEHFRYPVLRSAIGAGDHT